MNYCPLISVKVVKCHLIAPYQNIHRTFLPTTSTHELDHNQCYQHVAAEMPRLCWCMPVAVLKYVA